MTRIACKLFLLFTFLLTAPVVESSHILAGIYFVFLKNFLKQTIPNSDLSEGIEKVDVKYSRFWHFFVT